MHTRRSHRLPALSGAAAVAALLVACAGGVNDSDGAGGDAGNAGDSGDAAVSPFGDEGVGRTDANEAGHVSDGGSGSKDAGKSSGGDGAAAPADAGTGADAGSGSHADGGGEGGNANDASAPEGGGDAGSVTGDPFDPQSCPGQSLTEAQAAQFFHSGATQAVIGSYTIEMRQRSCNAVTGCGAWGAPTTDVGVALGGATLPLMGEILLNVQGSSVVLALQDSTEELPYSMGTTCSAVDGSPETCGTYEYDMGDQWGGSGGYYPTMAALTDLNSANVQLSGVLTSQCLRLVYAANDANGDDVQEFALLSPVSPGPPLPPNPCPGGGTQMACGSQAAGQTTCCQKGLTTCPQSGCDCWAACQ